MSYSVVPPTVGSPQISPFNLPDTTARAAEGLIFNAVDPYWGGGEFKYCKAGGTIRSLALVTLLPVITGGKLSYVVTEAASVANSGRFVGVAMVPATIGQFLMVQIGGVVPINSNASIAADSAYANVAAGQAGALVISKQVLNSRIALAATTTVAKAGCTANSGSTRLNIPNADGLFIGCYLSGTGIAATTTVADIDPSGTVVTLSLATTAAVTGTVTGTYNNAVIFYNVAHLNRPFLQGAIT